MHPTDPSRPLGERLKGTNLYLVGMMGSGKSTVGPLLAEALGYRFLDADAVISQAAGCSIPEIFERDGEEGFRSLERQVLQQLSQWHSLVVATGGGIVTVPANWGELRQGVVIWLDVAEEELLRRLQADPGGRPLLTGEDPAAKLRHLLERRQPLYAQADLHLTAYGEDASGISQRVLKELPALLKVPDAPQTTAP
jgi:shikimate kinase